MYACLLSIPVLHLSLLAVVAVVAFVVVVNKLSSASSYLDRTSYSSC